MHRHSNRARRHRASAFPTSPFDALEPRRLLSGTLTVAGTPNADAITVGVNASGGIHVVLNNVATDYAAGAYSALQVNSGAGADSINVQATVVPTTVSSSGPATVTVASATQGLQGITGPLTVSNSSPLTHLTLDDTAAAPLAECIVGATADGQGDVSGLSPMPITFSAGGVADLKVISGPGTAAGTLWNTFAVQRTVAPTTVQSYTGGVSFGRRTSDLTIVGANGNTQGIVQPLTIVNGFATLDDSSDPLARQITISVVGNTDDVRGLTPADVTASTASTFGPGLLVKLPSVGGSTVQVNGCLAGLGVQSAANGPAHDAVTIGNGSPTGIQFPLYVQNTAGSDDVTIDDSGLSLGTTDFGPVQQSYDGPGLQVGTPSGRVVVNNAGGGGTVRVRGGNGFYVDDLSALPTGTLDLEPGAAGGTVDVWKTPAGSTVNVTGRGGSVQVQANRAGAGNLAGGALNVSNDAGTLTLAAGDYLDGTPRHVTLDTFVPNGTSQVWGRVTGVLPGIVSYDGAGAIISLNPGHVADTFDVLNTPPRANPGPINLTLVCDATDAVNVSGTGANTNLQINHLAPPGSALSADLIDFSAGRISDGTLINVGGQDLAMLSVRGASASDLFVGDTNSLAHGTSHVFFNGVNSVRLQTGTFQKLLISNLELDGTDTSLLLGPANYSFTTLTLNGGKAVVGGSGVLRVGSLSITNGGQLDLTHYQLQITFPAGADALAATRALLQSGFMNGAWNGPGIVSSTLDSSHGLLATLLAGNNALVRSARYGDADLSGRVDFTDLLQLAQNYGQNNASWAQGDFDYDGTVGFSDLLKLAQNYGTLGSVGTAAAMPLTSSHDAEGSLGQKLHRISRKTVP